MVRIDLAHLKPALAFYIALIILWEALFLLNLGPSCISPSPQGVASSLWLGLADGLFALGVAASMKRVLIGYCFSLFTDVVLGLGMGRVRLVHGTLDSLALGLQALPSIAWLPLAILWFGLNETAIIFASDNGRTPLYKYGDRDGCKKYPAYLHEGRTQPWHGWIEVLHRCGVSGRDARNCRGDKARWGFAWRSMMAGNSYSRQ